MDTFSIVVIVVLGIGVPAVCITYLYQGATQHALAALMVEALAQRTDAALVETYTRLSEPLFAKEGIIDSRRKRIRTNYAAMIVRGRIGKAERKRLRALLFNFGGYFPSGGSKYDGLGTRK